ncbi:hypothetical protein BRD00_10890 [Halobacteriales archaeon QS_8_69_26]|nr:MAG: hypothetical protein BRD00_10890 [Halobacteriales archaeon QS_8_69_26]
MSDPRRRGPGQGPDRPTPQEIHAAMVPGRCYVAADLVAEFGKQYEGSERTVRQGLDELVAEGRIVRSAHADGTVTYRRTD